MRFDEYQIEARKTAIFPSEDAIAYTALGLNGEAGEVAEVIKKAIRDDGGQLTPMRIQLLIGEMGDVLWYLANMAAALDISLADIAQANLDKLRSRQVRGVLGGSGGDR